MEPLGNGNSSHLQAFGSHVRDCFTTDKTIKNFEKSQQMFRLILSMEQPRASKT